MSDRKLHFETLQIHGGYHVDASQARGVAIHPTAAYHFPTCDYAANLFTLSEAGYIYTRLHNPTTAAYEERIAALYGGVGALATQPVRAKSIGDAGGMALMYFKKTLHS